MKKRICLIYVFTSLFLIQLHAETPQLGFNKHEVRAGVGFWGSNEFISSYSDVATIGLTGGMYSVSNEKTSGDYSLTYRYSLKKRFSVGASLVYSNLKEDLYSNGDYSGKSTNNYFTIAPEIEYRYVDADIFKMYMFAGAGLTINNQEVTTDGKASVSNTPYFNFQISPLCIRLGKAFGFYLETGFGYKGIMNLGLYANF